MSPLSLYTRFVNSLICRGLTEAEAEALFSLCEVRRFDAYKPLFREGETTDALWVVLEGDVEISQGGKVLAEVGCGSALGEVALLRGASKHSCTVSSICPVTAMRISGPQFQKLLAAHDVAILKVVANLAEQLAHRLAALNERWISGGAKGLAVARSSLRRVTS